MASKNISDDPRTGMLWVVGVIGVVLIVTIVVWLQAIFYRVEEAETGRKIHGRVPEQLARLRAEQQGELHSYGWVDEKSGVVRLPIDRAMELVVSESAMPAMEK
ncbi:MAG: hypothetical protein ABIK65_14660 [Candidatus Eisenbacteria bacterium]